jgi:PAS domain-containing serine/threonine kinase
MRSLSTRYNSGSHPTNSPLLAVCPGGLQNLENSSLRLASISPECTSSLEARLYSSWFPVEHKLNPYFVHTYQLGDELGSGGHGFVITARHRIECHEVAVKFIIKEKVPKHAWMEDETIGKLPTEVMLLSFIDHKNIVKCLDIFEDDLYFYLV